MCYDRTRGDAPQPLASNEQVGTSPGNLRGPATLEETHEKSVHNHYMLAERDGRAARFFRDNPAFDEFIRLIREGVVQIWRVVS